jgi:hypothetical protein
MSEHELVRILSRRTKSLAQVKTVDSLNSHFVEILSATRYWKTSKATLKKMPPLTGPAKASGGFGGEGT